MMSYIFSASLLVGFLLLLGYCFFQAMDGDIRFGIATVVLVVLALAGIMKVTTEEEAKGPCLKEETSYAYNAATKTSAPYTHCVERGTWVK